MMKLSIVTITYNAEACIERTILSIINQTMPIYEYILIDGRSKDKTNEIIENYRQQIEDMGIHFIHISEPDKGISDAFNKGIALATGGYIGIINADDELLPNTTLELQKFIAGHDVDIIYGNCLWVDEANKISYIRKPKCKLDRLYYDLVLIHPSTFVRKSAYEKYGAFNIEYKLCMDKELLLRMYVGGAKFEYLDKELTIFRAGGKSDQSVVKTVKEGIKLSNSYNCPRILTYSNAVRKIVKHKMSSILKKMHIYTVLKKAKRM